MRGLEEFMFIVEIKFAVPAEHEPSEVEDTVWNLLAAWDKNGQIHDHYSLFAAPDGGLRALANIPEETALDDVHANRWVNNALAKLRTGGMAPPTVEVKGVEVDGWDACTCKQRSALMLITNFLSGESPVKCLDCYGVVPLYRLPHLADTEDTGLLLWQEDYRPCDTLQIGCQTGERFALREMYRVGSSLSRHGRELCERIEASTGIPTYYYLHKWNRRNHTHERKRRCPSCEGSWLLPEPIRPIFDFRCDRCRLLSNIASSLGPG